MVNIKKAVEELKDLREQVVNEDKKAHILASIDHIIGFALQD